VRRAFAVLAVLASVWGAVVWLLDGVALSVGPLRLSSSDSIRPLVAAAAAAIVHFALSSQTAAREDARRLRRALTPQRVALLLTSVVISRRRTQLLGGWRFRLVLVCIADGSAVGLARIARTRSSVHRGDQSDLPHDVQVADERRFSRRILGTGNVLDCWNDGFERRNAGLAASVAISIRPKLLPLAAVLAGWTMFARPRRRLAVFALATLPGCVAVAAINNHVFKSPLTSGYGDLSSLFATENIDDTISSYFRWLVESQTVRLCWNRHPGDSAIWWSPHSGTYSRVTKANAAMRPSRSSLLRRVNRPQ
jgi:hypothetical protein